MDGWGKKTRENERELTLLSRDELQEIVRSRTRTLENVMDGMVDVLLTLDAEGRIELVNRAIQSTLGYEPAAVVGKPIDVLLADPEGGTEPAELLTRDEFGALLVHRGQVPDVEVAFSTADGATIPMTLSTSAIERDDGGIDGYVCVAKDISDRIERERLLRHKTERLELLTQLVRHDIYNDAILISELVQRLQRADDDGDDSVSLGPRERQLLDHVGACGTNITSLTETARTLLETIAELGEDRHPTPLASTLEREIANASTLSEAAVVTVDGEVPDVTIWANEMLGSVFRNLLTNAIQHNDEPTPTVTVSTTLTETSVTVRIADNGPGVPEAVKASLRGDERSLETNGPHGFGLYIVETVVDQYGGRVELEAAGSSPSNDRARSTTGGTDGTTFAVTFERVTDSAGR